MGCIAAIQLFITAILLVSTTTVSSADTSPIPADASSLNTWFQHNVKPLADRKGTIDPALEAAEAKPRTIKVRKDGSGDFKTLKDAINSIPTGNKERVIVDIGPGEYVEKLKIEREKPFVTFLGSPSNMPTLSFGGTAREYGTVYSATLEAEADYFVAANIIIKGTEIHVIPDEEGTFITAQARNSESEDTGFSFVHCKVDGTGNGTHLGRAWMSRPRVVFAYTTMGSVVNPEGWSNNFHPERDQTVLFGEYKCEGPGADPKGRARSGRQLTPDQVAPFISLGFIEASKWLLPPPN
ncbi:unnamed protein product [Dovyalis caffra]|uniref:pectinesterase n=1 Tax=Dovyalis caffra TaxID=77055 RepID=A0AAV1RKD4_9ROSI|nr:unnamed protein product [Dovyalis caffra]